MGFALLILNEDAHTSKSIFGGSGKVLERQRWWKSGRRYSGLRETWGSLWGGGRGAEAVRMVLGSLMAAGEARMEAEVLCVVSVNATAA